jgi:very-short-patch-repair endonuclease
VRVDFISSIEHKSLDKPKRRVEKMLSFLSGLEYKLSPEGAIAFFGGKAYLIPYDTLYQKSISTRKSVKDITYNLRTGRFYKEVVNQDFEEIGFRELVFIFLKKMRFLPEFLDVLDLVEDVEAASRDLGVEAILDFGRLRFLFRCCQKTLADLPYETLRDRYLGNKGRVERLKKSIFLKASKLLEEKRKKESLKSIRLAVRDRVFSYLSENNIEMIDDYESIKQGAKLICSCGRFFTYHLNTLLQYRVQSCPECRKTKSSLESFFEEEIVFRIPASFDFRKKIENLEIDFFAESLGIGIEINGSYWHSNRKKDPFHLQRKKIFFLDRGINVLFFYDFWIFGKTDLILSIIKSKIGMFDRVFYARKGEIREISYTQASEFFEENHLSGGRIPFSYSFGFFVGDELISVASFSKPRYRKEYDYELIRFAHKKHATTIGFLGKVLDIFRPRSLVSYADLMISDGRVYEKLGFKRISLTRPGYFYTRDGREVFSRETFQKHRIKEYYSTGKFGITFFDESLTEEKIMEINGFYRLPTCGNLVYTYSQ